MSGFLSIKVYLDLLGLEFPPILPKKKSGRIINLMKKARRSGIAIIILGILGIIGITGYKFLKTGGYLVTEVIDGDTIKIQKSKFKNQNLIFKDCKDEILDIRYIGIDTPELGKGKKKNECYAQKAKELNKRLVLGKEVKLEFDVNEMDRFGRYLAYVYAKDAKKENAKNAKEIFVNEYLLEQGAGEFQLDTVNLKYQDVLIEAAEKGHEEENGLWKKCAENPQVGCVVKGNVDRMDKRWYHLPSFRHYNQIVMRLDQGDRWFCTEEKAIEAGFERARE